MKILFFTQDIPYPITSGHHVRTFHYLMPLIKAHEVTVAAFGDREKDAAGIAYLEQAGAAVKLIGNKRTFKKHQRILSAIKALFTPLPYSIYMRFDLYLKHELDKLIDDCGFDIVICDGIHLSLNLSKDIKCRKILDEHNIESTLVSRYAATEKNFLKKTYACMELIKFRRFENMTWERFDEIHVCSETDRGQIVGQIKDVTVRVVPNPVNTEKFRPRGIPERPGSILYTGLMGWRPNIDAVVHFAGDIYPLIKRSVPDITFTVIGKNPAPGVEELGKRDETIKVLGFVDDIAAHICESQVFVVPLRIGSGTRLKILEALSMEKAIVSTSIGCEGLDVTNGENILIADTPEDFAAAVVRLLNDPALRRKLGENGRKLVSEKYSTEKMGTDLINFINEMTK